MRINLYLFLFLIAPIHFIKAQTIFPYLEVKNTNDIEKISIDELQSTYQFNHFLADIKLLFHYTNHSNEPIESRFIVPQHHSQNAYHLKAKYNENEIKLISKPLQTIKQELKNIQAKSGYENQVISQNLILNLPNIPPNTQIIIELNFSKIIESNTILYEIEIPEIITLRTEEFTVTNKTDNHFKKPNAILNQFKLTGNIPIASFNTNEQSTKIEKQNNREWTIKNELFQKQKITYQYNANEISTAVQSFTENSCDYILGIIQPPKEITTISPREFIFVLDASGSMKGKPIEEIKKMIQSTLMQLKPHELFNIVLYSTNHENLAPNSIEASPENIDKAILFIAKEYGKGNQKLNEAIEKLQLFKLNPAFNRIIILVTDGDLAINQNVHLAIKSHLKSAHFFVLGIGNHINYRAMNFLGLSIGSQPLVINNENEMNYKINQFQKQLLKPLLRNIQIQSKNINFSETYPKNINGFLSTDPVHFVTKDCKKIYPKQLEITAKNGSENFNKIHVISKENQTGFTEAIKFYWAKKHIDFLLKDEDRCGDICKKDGRYRDEIIKIGTEFNLSTPYSVLIQNNDSTNFNQAYDTDNDGIPDWLDQCNNEKGNLLTKGCPIDKLNNTSKENYIQDYSNELIRVIEFDFDKNIIRPIDYPILDKIILLMKEKPSLNFYIEGHTDAQGTAEYNQKLALNRAKAVLSYFEAHGLNKNRFTIIGKGDTVLKYPMCRPANKCEEWRNLQNRRVEFKLKKD